MSQMRAVQVTSANGPFELVERAIPDPSTRHVRIKVQACGVCHSDSFTKMGAFPGIQFPRVPGHEIVGIVDAVGADLSAAIGGLAVDGKLIVLGASPEPIEVSLLLLISDRRAILGWPSGTSIDSEDTLAFSAMTDIRPMIETMPLERAPEAYDRMMSGEARFRMVLTTGV
jgi:D-arabinose 1-dehydrogenase-like Zn-dependent alcohol dehydrogenase